MAILPLPTPNRVLADSTDFLRWLYGEKDEKAAVYHEAKSGSLAGFMAKCAESRKGNGYVDRLDLNDKARWTLVKMALDYSTSLRHPIGKGKVHLVQQRYIRNDKPWYRYIAVRAAEPARPIIEEVMPEAPKKRVYRKFDKVRA